MTNSGQVNAPAGSLTLRKNSLSFSKKNSQQVKKCDCNSVTSKYFKNEPLLEE